MAELHDIVSQYISFEPNEIRLPITEEDRWVFHKIIADQEGMRDIVMDNYQYLLQHGHNGEEKNRVAWNQPIHMPTASLSNINVMGRQTKPEIQGQDVSPFTELEKQIHDAKKELSKSIDPVLEENGKVKKTGGKKSKFKSASAELIPSPIQTQPIPISHEKIVENSIKTIMNIKNIVEK
ncbi:hypothetical protein C1646_749871 [Rhizophagus diaphanus]|nr:hypothetical protein C1646_749871 [Rhizophagus diaphanus] [Rhizophagus sp. MUCL 43196]